MNIQNMKDFVNYLIKFQYAGNREIRFGMCNLSIKTGDNHLHSEEKCIIGLYMEFLRWKALYKSVGTNTRCVAFMSPDEEDFVKYTEAAHMFSKNMELTYQFVYGEIFCPTGIVDYEDVTLDGVIEVLNILIKRAEKGKKPKMKWHKVVDTLA